MKKYRFIINMLLFAVIIVALSACEKVDEEEPLSTNETKISVDETKAEEVSKAEEETTAIETEETKEPEDSLIEEDIEEEAVVEAVDYQSVGVNEVGHIMVVMYHGIMDNPPYHITKEQFVKDLTYFYENDYRLISMSDYLSQTIDIEAGKTPIVFTFDDGLKSTFALKEVNGELVVDPDTAIGIIETFAKEHPDFGKSAMLFIHATDNNFPGAGDGAQRLTWLVDHGYELGNHSATHANLSKLSRDELIEEIGRVDETIVKLLPGYTMNVLTYPFGARPKEAYRKDLIDGTYNSVTYHYDVGFREGPSGQMVPPIHIDFSPYNTPRVRGSEGAVQDMWWFLNYYDQEATYLKYISDGDPSTVVVPMKLSTKVDTNKLNGKTLITYE